MNILTERAPKTVNIGGAEIPINSDFRVSIRFEQLIDEPIPDEEKILEALALYYPFPVTDISEAIKKMLWFYTAGKDGKRPGTSREGVQNIYSYSYDDEYIYAAFLDQYGIDLQDIPYLHWWKFKAMFVGLKSDSRIVEIMGYRGIEITSQMSSEQKQFYRKMKKQFAIPLPKSEREKLSAIEEALLNGGNLSGIL